MPHLAGDGPGAPAVRSAAVAPRRAARAPLKGRCRADRRAHTCTLSPASPSPRRRVGVGEGLRRRRPASAVARSPFPAVRAPRRAWRARPPRWPRPRPTGPGPCPRRANRPRARPPGRPPRAARPVRAAPRRRGTRRRRHRRAAGTRNTGSIDAWAFRSHGAAPSRGHFRTPLQPPFQARLKVLSLSTHLVISTPLSSFHLNRYCPSWPA